MQGIDIIFYIAILVMSVVLHEVAHGFAAERFGDRTARYAGRLTLNPLRHLDPFGSVILPLLLLVLQSPFLFGWARPVPYVPENLSPQRLGTLAVAAAGVLSNIFIALLFGLVLRFTAAAGYAPDFYAILTIIVVTNLALAIFNLIPIPPLDGSKILFSLLPDSMYSVQRTFEAFALPLFLILIFFLANYLWPVLTFVFNLITGIAL